MRWPTPRIGPDGAAITNTAPGPATTPATASSAHDQRSTTAVLAGHRRQARPTTVRRPHRTHQWHCLDPSNLNSHYVLAGDRWSRSLEATVRSSHQDVPPTDGQARHYRRSAPRANDR